MFWRGESLRQRADPLLHHFELKDAFGWKVDPKILADKPFKGNSTRSRGATRASEQATLLVRCKSWIDRSS